MKWLGRVEMKGFFLVDGEPLYLDYRVKLCRRKCYEVSFLKDKKIDIFTCSIIEQVGCPLLFFYGYLLCFDLMASSLL